MEPVGSSRSKKKGDFGEIHRVWGAPWNSCDALKPRGGPQDGFGVPGMDLGGFPNLWDLSHLWGTPGSRAGIPPRKRRIRILRDPRMFLGGVSKFCGVSVILGEPRIFGFLEAAGFWGSHSREFSRGGKKKEFLGHKIGAFGINYWGPTWGSPVSPKVSPEGVPKATLAPCPQKCCHRSVPKAAPTPCPQKCHQGVSPKPHPPRVPESVIRECPQSHTHPVSPKVSPGGVPRATPALSPPRCDPSGWQGCGSATSVVTGHEWGQRDTKGLGTRGGGGTLGWGQGDTEGVAPAHGGR